MRATIAGASASVKPNFWSSWAVARKSWVSACTPLLTRTSTAWVAPARSTIVGEPVESRSRCRSRSSRCRPRPRCSSSATLLLLPWNPRRAGSAPAARATASSPPDADVDGEALVGDPAHDLGAQERLAGVVDARLHAVRLDRRAECGQGAAGVLAHLVLVDDVQRRAELVAQLRAPRRPAIHRTPSSSRSADAGHTPSASAFASAGGRSQSGASEVEADNSDQSWKGCFCATAAGLARTQRGAAAAVHSRAGRFPEV